MFIYVYCSVVTQGKNESGLLTILAAVPGVHLFCACIERHTMLYNISVPEHMFIYRSIMFNMWIYVVEEGAVWIPFGCRYAVTLRCSSWEIFGHSGKQSSDLLEMKVEGRCF